MHGVAVAPVRAPENAAVVVKAHRAHTELVFAVAVQVRGHAVVVAVGVAGVGARGKPGIIPPALDQFFVHHVIGDHGHAGVVAAHGNGGGLHPVQIAHRAQKTVAAVAVVVAPRALGDFPARVFVVNRIQHRAGKPVKERIVFRALQNIPRTVAVGFAAVPDDVSDTVHRAVGGLAGHLRFAVQIEIRDQKLRVVRARADILPQIHSPEPLARQPQAVDIDIARRARLRVVLGIARVPFEENLVNPVAVHIAHGTVARRIGVVRAGCRHVQRDVKIALV